MRAVVSMVYMMKMRPQRFKTYNGDWGRLYWCVLRIWRTYMLYLQSLSGTTTLMLLFRTEKSLYLSSFPRSFRPMLKPWKAPHAPHHKRTEIKIFTRGWGTQIPGNLIDQRILIYNVLCSRCWQLMHYCHLRRDWYFVIP